MKGNEHFKCSEICRSSFDIAVSHFNPHSFKRIERRNNFNKSINSRIDPRTFNLIKIFSLIYSLFCHEKCDLTTSNWSFVNRKSRSNNCFDGIWKQMHFWEKRFRMIWYEKPRKKMIGILKSTQLASLLTRGFCCDLLFSWGSFMWNNIHLLFYAEVYI